MLNRSRRVWNFASSCTASVLAEDWIRSDDFLSQILEFRVVDTSAELPHVLAQLNDTKAQSVVRLRF